MENPRFKEMAYGPLGKAVEEAMPHSEADAVGVLAAALALYSSALNGHVLQPSGRPVVVWTVLVGESRFAKKGFALGTAEAILSAAIRDFLAVRRKGGVSSGPSLIAVMHDALEESRLTESGEDGRVVMVDEEWPTTLGMVRKCPKYSGILRSTWDGHEVANIVKGADGRPVVQRIEKPLLGFHAHIQPGLWAESIKLREALGGTYNRMLPVRVEGSKKIRDPNPLRHVTPSRPLALAYEWARKEQRMMEFNDAALDWVDALRDDYDEILYDMPESLSCYFSRADEQVIRVACVLTAAARKTVVTVPALKAARAFVEYSMESVRALVIGAEKPKRVERTLADKIRDVLANLGGSATSTVLYRSLGSRHTADEVAAVVATMPDVETERLASSRPGRKPVEFRLLVPKPQPDPTPVLQAVTAPELQQRAVAGTRRTPAPVKGTAPAVAARPTPATSRPTRAGKKKVAGAPPAAKTPVRGKKAAAAQAALPGLAPNE